MSFGLSRFDWIRPCFGLRLCVWTSSPRTEPVEGETKTFRSTQLATVFGVERFVVLRTSLSDLACEDSLLLGLAQVSELWITCFVFKGVRGQNKQNYTCLKQKSVAS